MNILIIDDNEVLLHSLVRGISRLGHQVFTANNLAGGRKQALQCSPDLILLDFELPDGNGFELVLQLSLEKKLERTTFVMMSGLVRSMDEVSEDPVKRKLVKGFLMKPFTLQDLGRIIDLVSEPVAHLSGK